MRPSKPSRAELHLIKENDNLRTTIVVLRRQIEDKQGAVRLETLVRERLTRIDQLTAQVEQLRAQNQRLDVENALLAGMVQLPLGTSLPTN